MALANPTYPTLHLCLCRPTPSDGPASFCQPRAAGTTRTCATTLWYAALFLLHFFLQSHLRKCPSASLSILSPWGLNVCFLTYSFSLGVEHVYIYNFAFIGSQSPSSGSDNGSGDSGGGLESLLTDRDLFERYAVRCVGSSAGAGVGVGMGASAGDMSVPLSHEFCGTSRH